MPAQLPGRIVTPAGYADLPSGRTRVVVEGAGPTVVFVPGATLPLFVWDGLVERVTAAGFRTVRYDLLGRGDSDAPRVAYDAALHRRQLREVIDAASPAGPVHLVALAFGCLIAADLTLHEPARAAGLACLAPDGFGVRLPPVTRILRLPVVGPAVVRAAGTRTLMSRLADYSADAALVGQLRERFRPYARRRGLHRAVLSSLRTMPIHDAVEVYGALPSSLPRLVLWGRDDRVAPLPAGHRLRAAFPGAHIEILDNVGHLPHAERPDETSRLVVGFLRTATTA